MGKKFKGKTCAYCGEREAVTGDHIFAREFFLPGNRANLPQAPICDECNNEKLKLEHYLTTVLPFGGRHSASAEDLSSMVPKRLANNAKLHRELGSGQEQILADGAMGEHSEAMTIPFDGEKLEQMLAMAAKGLISFHWCVTLGKGHDAKVYTVTKAGEQMFDRFFRGNVRDRVAGNLGDGTFTYEGVQALDDPNITAWRFHIYGGLVSCEDTSSRQGIGSQVVVMTGPDAAFSSLKGEDGPPGE